mgnify:CR=1 FL=1
MALKGSSTISFADINTELGRGSTTQIGINEAEGGTYGAINQASAQKPDGSTPNAINEWYSYDHSAVYITFDVSLATSAGGVCNLTTIRTVKSVNNSATLAGAAGYALYRMPQNQLITALVAYTHVAEYDGTATVGFTYTLNSSTGVVGSSTGDEC